jgi:hypothetical protein
MWRFNGFDPNKKDKEGKQVVWLWLRNDVTGSVTHLDCDGSLDDYELTPLINKPYQQFSTVTELVKLYELKPRQKSKLDYVRISSFKIGA